MQQRKSGRPSGTNGSDFSYRMVVDSRRLSIDRIIIHGLSISKERDLNGCAVSSPVVGLIALLIGELGRRRSRVSFLRVYMVISSIAMLLSLFCAVSSNSIFEFIQSPSDWESKKFELIENILLLLGFLVQVFTISAVISLVGNMSQPKRAS